TDGRVTGACDVAHIRPSPLLLILLHTDMKGSVRTPHRSLRKGYRHEEAALDHCDRLRAGCGCLCSRRSAQPASASWCRYRRRRPWRRDCRCCDRRCHCGRGVWLRLRALRLLLWRPRRVRPGLLRLLTVTEAMARGCPRAILLLSGTHCLRRAVHPLYQRPSCPISTASSPISSPPSILPATSARMSLPGFAMI